MRYQPAYRYPGLNSSNFAGFNNRSSYSKKAESKKTAPIRSFDILKFLLLIVGFAILLVGIAHFFTAREVKSWDQREVTITRSDVVRLPLADRSPVFTAKIEYQYFEDGKLITGHELTLGKIRSKSPGEVKKKIAAYSIGRTVLAHVNPANADKAFLKSNPLSYVYGLIAPGLVMMLISLMISQVQHMRALETRRKDWRFGEFNALIPQPVYLNR